MKRIKVSELRAGMAFDQPVYIDPNNVLVQSRQEILDKDIERLKKWGILEVETNGNPINLNVVEAPASGAAAMPTATTAEQPSMVAEMPRASSNDPELKQLALEYEAFRKARRAFRTMVQECADGLQTNLQQLMDGKAFDNQSVMRTAGRLADELLGKPLQLIGFHGLRFSGPAHLFHSIHAASYAAVLGQALGYSRPRLHELVFAVLLMDCGMLRIPLHVRDKSSELNEAERSTVKTHPLIGYQLLVKNGKVKASLATVALQHQESFDGQGYPQSLKGGQIEETARIATIADVYTAMIERRPYRKGHLPYDAMKHMLSVQMHHFDPRLLRTFLGRISIYPLGSLVQLSNQFVGMVVSSRAEKPLRPVLRVMRGADGATPPNLQFLDLIKEADLYIVRALDPAAASIDLEAEI
ncbi:MAG: HD-GYP domain-containing protein [Leptospirales bacterium]|nr:HD-GYP domain-containing protein [Leptospirales bacterium]